MSLQERRVILYEPDESLRADCCEALSRAGWQCDIVSSPDEVAAPGSAVSPRVVFLAADAKGERLVPTLREIARRHPKAAVVLIADSLSETSLLRWMHAGVRDVLRRPVDGSQVAACAEQCGSAEAGPAASGEVGAAPERQMLGRAIHALVEIMEAKDKYSVGYAREVAALAERVGAVMGLAERAVHAMRIGALLHDVGRVGLRDEVVNKGGPLNVHEQAHIATHPVVGEQILKHLFDDPEILSVVRHHHEWYNGRGYPDALAEDVIPLTARIVAVADAYVAITQDRPHRLRKSPRAAVREICTRTGTQFCPKVVGSLLEVMGYRRPDSAPDAPGAGDGRPTARDADERVDLEPLEARPVGKEELDRRIKRVAELRALSNVVADVVTMTSFDEVNVEALSAKITCDHALATKMLRLANSAMYGGRMKVESIERAVLKIGMKRVRQLVLGIGVIGQWRDSTPGDPLPRQAFWQHSMATALLARHVATVIEYPDEQNAFTAGLLHDVGQLVLQEALDRNYTAILAHARANHRFLPDVERQYLNLDHASLMYTVGQNWGLPQSLVEVMGRHHEPWETLQKLEQGTLQLMMCVRIADILAHALCLGDSGLGTIQSIPESFLDFLRLDVEALRTAMDDIPGQVAELGQAYGLAPETEKDRRAPRRRRPQREGVYVAEDGAALDPVRICLASEAAEFEVASGMDAWKTKAERAWCWARVATPAFVREIIETLQSVPGDVRQATRNLLLILPVDSQEVMPQLLAKAGIRFVAEPWNVVALRETLDEMRSVKLAGNEGDSPAAVAADASQDASHDPPPT